MDMQILKSVQWFWVRTAWIVFLGASMALALVGPTWALWIGGGGAFLFLLGWVLKFFHPVSHPKNVHFIVLFLSYGILSGAIFACHHFFLKALDNDSLTLPSLTRIYQDPDGQFILKGPRGWSVETQQGPRETRWVFTPEGRENYMGVSELKVRVQKLEPSALSNDEMMAAISKNQVVDRSGKNGEKLFRFETQPAKLINGSNGTWTFLDVQRFWVPLRQVSLFGIKNGYLCAISATGLKAHSTLSQVLCLGVFETIGFIKS